MITSSQASLFDKSQLPPGGGLLSPGQNRRHTFTHGTATHDQASNSATVGAVGEGLGVCWDCRAFGAGQQMADPIRQRSLDLVATQKERTAWEPRHLAKMTLGSVERAGSEDEANPGQLPVTAGILVDKRLNQGVPVTARYELQRQLCQGTAPAKPRH